jgi:methionyl-tRNA formyltransferase
VRLGYPVYPAQFVMNPEFAKEVRIQSVDLLLNAHSLYIIHHDILSAVRVGAFNLHPGPLPRYAGLNAVSWALYHGEVTHGVTVHWMLPGIDTGPIAYQELFPIEETDTGVTVSLKCIRIGLQLMDRLLTTASTDPRAIPRIGQDLSQRTYFGRQIPDDGCIHWTRSAEEIENFIRASDFSPFPSPWGHPRAWFSETHIGLIKARRTQKSCHCSPGSVGPVKEGYAYVATSDKWLAVGDIWMNGRCEKAGVVLKVGDRLFDGRL